MANDSIANFADGQSIIDTAGDTIDSESTILLKAGEDALSGDAEYDDPGGLMKNFVAIYAKTAITAVSGAIETFSLYNHTTNTGLASGTLIGSVAYTFTATSTPAGTLLGVIAIPPGKFAKAYVGISIALSAQDITAGTIFAELTDHIEVRNPA